MNNKKQESFAEIIKRRDENIKEVAKKLKSHSPDFVDFISRLITSLEKKGASSNE